MSELTPMMKQYYKIKEKYKDCLLFFRVGDFFEVFDEDAKIASRELGIALTSRDKKHPMAGVPHHALFHYVKRLIEKGYSVAICDQVEDPSQARGLVRREVIRVITPGTLIEEELLSKENNYLLSIYKDEQYGIALIDVSTGEFITTTLNSFNEVIAEILKFNPVECIVPKNFDQIEELKKLVPVVHILNGGYFDLSKCLKSLKETITNFDELDLTRENIISCGSVIRYIKNTLLIKDIKFKLQTYIGKNYMILDTTTLKNLEIFRNLVDGSERGSLLEVLDKTKTSMGRRLLKKWIQRPLINIDEIEKRLDAVEELYKKSFIRLELRDILENIYDMERICSRIEYGRCNPKDLVSLKDSLKEVEKLKNFKFLSEKLNELIVNLEDLKDVVELIEKAIMDDPPISVKDGGIIKTGYSFELDELRKIKDNHENYLKEIEERERKRTGIEKLRVGYNSVIGYYIEVPKSKINLVPSYYKRKQTLTNYERYSISELEALEEKILSSEERIKELEYKLFLEIRKQIAENIEKIRKCASNIAELDVLSTFSEVSVLYNYKRPKVNNEYDIIIKNGRHPTVELNTKFVPNDVMLTKDNFILIITGPNMAGKSTYLRMTALISIMAQIGCFVPAEYAVIGIVDRIFTRIGTIDDITRGYSSFMIEMLEVGQILRNATSKSLVILDEVGKSTSSLDGSCISWAIIEYLHELGTKTLFATHYQEVTELENVLKGVKNYHFRIIEDGEDIKFDRKIKRGSSKESYGIKIAKMVLPKEVVKRASEVYENLNKETSERELINELKSIDINNLRPIDALYILDKLVKKCKEKN